MVSLLSKNHKTIEGVRMKSQAVELRNTLQIRTRNRLATAFKFDDERFYEVLQKMPED